jgi:phage antirepressor YoqD-like protein
MPFGDLKYSIETTIGQLNFFKWAIENKIIHYIEKNMNDIEEDMNLNNSISKAKKHNDSLENIKSIRKRREELSVSSSKCLKKEKVDVVIKFV